jgi:guanylate kinase
MKPDNLTPLCPPSQPLLVVLSGLSGAGKDTALDGLRNSGLPFYFSVSATTRPPRKGEKDGVDYYFVSRQKFQEMVDGGGMVEWAEVYGNLYGRPREPIRQALQRGQDVLVRIDVQGAAAYKELFPDAVAIFIVPSTLADLEKRLKARGTETHQDLVLRLDTAREELEKLPVFDYIIENRNNEMAAAVERIKAIITAEKCRVTPREIKI